MAADLETAEITPNLIRDLLRDHVLGKHHKLPGIDTCRGIANGLDHLRLLHGKEPTWKLKTAKAGDAWAAVTRLCEELPEWLAYIEGQNNALGFRVETPDARRARRTIETALEALKDLREIDLSFTPVLPHPQLAISHERWHDYASRVASFFITMLEPTTPGLKLSNDGPVARFVFYVAPLISGENPPSVAAVAKHLQRASDAACNVKGDNPP